LKTKKYQTNIHDEPNNIGKRKKPITTGNHSSAIFCSINGGQLTMVILRLLLPLPENLHRKIYFMFLDCQNYSDWEAEQIDMYQNEIVMESAVGDGGWFDLR
jgi:hypothetical protein